MKELDIGSATSTIILISGNGTNLQAILDEITNNHLPIRNNIGPFRQSTSIRYKTSKKRRYSNKNH